MIEVLWPRRLPALHREKKKITNNFPTVWDWHRKCAFRKGAKKNKKKNLSKLIKYNFGHKTFPVLSAQST